MTEDERTECRLTYKEGVNLIENTSLPYMKTKRWIWASVMAFMLFLAIACWYETSFPSLSPELLEAGFTEAQALYLHNELVRTLYESVILGTLMAGAVTMAAVTGLQHYTVKETVRLVNLRREDEDE